MIVSVRFSVCFADINHFDGALIISRTTYALFPLPLLNIVARICKCCKKYRGCSVSSSGNNKE